MGTRGVQGYCSNFLGIFSAPILGDLSSFVHHCPIRVSVFRRKCSFLPLFSTNCLFFIVIRLEGSLLDSLSSGVIPQRLMGRHASLGKFPSFLFLGGPPRSGGSPSSGVIGTD